MKKTLLTCLAVLFIVYAGSAQKLFEKPLVYGLKTGINLSLFNDDVHSFDPQSNGHTSSFERFIRISPIIGFTVDYVLNRNLHFGAEVLYNTRGMAYRQENNSVIMIGQNGNEQAYNYFKYKLEYMEVPLTVNYNVSPLAQDNWTSFYIGLAPAVAVSTTTKLVFPTITAGPGNGRPDQSAEISGVRKFNTNLLGGLQVGGRPSLIGFYGDLRASYTLLPVFDEKVDGNNDNLDTKMLTFTIGLGLKF